MLLLIIWIFLCLENFPNLLCYLNDFLNKYFSEKC